MHGKKRLVQGIGVGKTAGGSACDFNAGGGQNVAEHQAQATAYGTAVYGLFQGMMCGRLAPAQIGFVDDVVMHQCGRLKHFNGAGQVDHGVTPIRRHVAGKNIEGVQCEQRTQSFASLAGGGGLVHNLFHHRFQGVGNLVGGGGGSQFPHQLNDAWLDDFAVVSSCAHA